VDDEGVGLITGGNAASLMIIAQDWNAEGFTIGGRRSRRTLEKGRNGATESG
jgi:hypothetical protein